jgi:hypothetical protein
MTFRIVVGDVEKLDKVADEMHKVFFEVNNINWTRVGTFEKISIMFEHIDEYVILLMTKSRLKTCLMSRAISLMLSDKKEHADIAWMGWIGVNQ